MSTVCSDNARIIFNSPGFRTMLARYKEHMTSCTICSPDAARKILFDACISPKVKTALGIPPPTGGATVHNFKGPL